jgi:hypothetical protein
MLYFSTLYAGWELLEIAGFVAVVVLGELIKVILHLFRLKSTSSGTKQKCRVRIMQYLN